MLRTATRTLLAISLGALVGCSSFRPPTFEAVGVRELERSDDKAVLAFSVRATNPNREPMALGPASYRVLIAGDEVFVGVRSPESTLHTFGSRVFELPAIVDPARIDASGDLSFAIRGSVIYKNPGALADVLFDAEVIVPEAALDIEGTIAIDGATP